MGFCCSGLVLVTDTDEASVFLLGCFAHPTATVINDTHRKKVVSLYFS